jgi:very-short-patch-repair endonuclease
MNVTGKVSGARRLRRNQTDAERILWLRRRDRRLNGLKFRRQVPIDRYVVDFFCTEAHLVIEVDGGQHASADETKRTSTLEAMGYLVLRFWNNEVHENIEGVLESILNALDRSDPPHPTPLPSGERENKRRVR